LRGTTQTVAAKQSTKKRQKQGSKYRNAEVRAVLDSQAQEIYAITTRSDGPQPPKLAKEAVEALEASMKNMRNL